jgi:integrase
MGTSVLMITKHYSHLTPLMKAKQFAGVVDPNGTGDAAQIRAIMSAHVANNNIMSLVQMGTGLTIPLVVQSPELTDAFDKRLKNQLKKSS